MLWPMMQAGCAEESRDPLGYAPEPVRAERAVEVLVLALVLGVVAAERGLAHVCSPWWVAIPMPVREYRCTATGPPSARGFDSRRAGTP
jgi:hypothetical protein